MYTILQSFSGFILSIAFVFTVVYLFYNVLELSVAYSDKDKIVKSKKRLLNWKLYAVIIVLSMLSLSVYVWSSYNLSREECLANDGVFKSWDSNIQWECFNPDLVNQENNLRVIVDE